MPYISKESQEGFEQLRGVIESTMIVDSGKLNYLVTLLAIQFMKTNGTKPDGSLDMRYAQMNAVVGALDSAKEEFRRRVMNPYETQKAFDASGFNGDPYSSLGV